MSELLSTVYLVRHGETAWSLTGQHTGLTDLPLTERGRANAARLGARLRALKLAKVLVSPLQRALQTCELAGLQPEAQIEPDLVEWNYGRYEGRTTAEIRALQPDWQLFRDGCPEGESPAQIGARADRVVTLLRRLPGDCLVFSSRHFLAVLAARWLEMAPANGRFFPLSTASLSVLGYNHSPTEPVIELWNDDHHLEN
ncbi:MAG TPA: histidine phosphatase family protein [Verrucomicrobiae bacterium]|nr:histidine phosphatase family protein [Verrucomicrobiae bacterium]